MYYISTDATLTSANLHSALASLSDDDLRYVLDGSSHVSREQRITDFMMEYYFPIWEWVAGECFYREKGKTLKEVKKYLKRKLGMLLIIPRVYKEGEGECRTAYMLCIIAVRIVHDLCNDIHVCRSP